MREITYRIPDESEAPTPPEGFKIIGYRTTQFERVELDKVEPYQTARYVPMYFDECFLFECVASDENTDIVCPSDLKTGKYESYWCYADNGKTFDLDKYKESLTE